MLLRTEKVRLCKRGRVSERDVTKDKVRRLKVFKGRESCVGEDDLKGTEGGIHGRILIENSKIGVLRRISLETHGLRADTGWRDRGLNIEYRL